MNILMITGIVIGWLLIGLVFAVLAFRESKIDFTVSDTFWSICGPIMIFPYLIELCIRLKKDHCKVCNKILFKFNK